MSSRPTSVQVLFGEAKDGDFSPFSEGVADRRRELYAGPWAWNHQVHGAAVRSVSCPETIDRNNGFAADALVTTNSGIALSVVTADCAPVVFWSASGNGVAIAHAGWRGLVEGVLENTVQHLRKAGVDNIGAQLGPCIHPCCYEFGPELDALVERYGEPVRGISSAASPSFDLPTAVDIALTRVGVSVDHHTTHCTACAPTPYFSHRARADRARLVSVVWIDR